MKSFLLNTVLATVSLVAPAFSAAPDKCDDFTPKYKNRLSVSPNSVSYERIAEDAIYAGFEYFEAPAFVRKNWDTTVTLTSFKVGQTFSIDCRSRILPTLGVSMFRDETRGLLYTDMKDEKGNTVGTQMTWQNPFLFHGTFGLSAEYDLLKAITFGAGVHGMVGGVWGGKIEEMGDVSWGVHATLPVTVRFGTDSHWDARFEPFAIWLKDYANYVGGKAALGYRF